MTARCQTCGRTIHNGELCYAAEWKVVEPGGVRVEVRYTCDECGTAVTA